ncbi:MAG: hypothetical protein KH095_05210 [Veillonella dispar]|uniref:hypothetical protein n=1 Tax=Veillonella dispar TaxID=39778 RepID=UPI0026EF9DFD|nr:hypothetical protein [Veillonella dispar]MBS7065533.1 hypothetical protein [Veillonella dispar]
MKKQYIIFLLGLIVLSILTYSIYYKIDKDNKHETAEAVLNRLVVVSNSEDIRMSYGQYSNGEWVQYLDMKVSPDYKTVMPQTLETISYIFPNSKVEKIETSDATLLYRITLEDGILFVNGSDMTPDNLRFIVHVAN